MLIDHWNIEPFQRWGVKVIVPASDEQITLEEAYSHLRVTPFGSPLAHPDDALILRQITASRQFCEAYSAKAFAPQILELGLSRFPSSHAYGYSSGTHIELPNGPVRGIVFVNYTDGDGATQTMDESTYILDNYSSPSRLYLAPTATWPVVQQRLRNAVKVRFAAGYDVQGDSPGDFQLSELVKQAMLLMLGNFYENRESALLMQGSASVLELPQAASYLLDLAGSDRMGIA